LDDPRARLALASKIPRLFRRGRDREISSTAGGDGAM
jgi:hypothetical protein